MRAQNALNKLNSTLDVRNVRRLNWVKAYQMILGYQNSTANTNTKLIANRSGFNFQCDAMSKFKAEKNVQRDLV